MKQTQENLSTEVMENKMRLTFSTDVVVCHPRLWGNEINPITEGDFFFRLQHLQVHTTTPRW